MKISVIFPLEQLTFLTLRKGFASACTPLSDGVQESFQMSFKWLNIHAYLLNSSK